MKPIVKTNTDIEKRHNMRTNTQHFVRLQIDDNEDSETMLALTKDISKDGISVLTYVPLPVGTLVKIERDNECLISAEVMDWEWDYDCDMARIGLKLLEKANFWPVNNHSTESLAS
jgi:hypothetical protein